MAKTISYSQDITQRFLLIRDEVINQGIVKNQREFGDRVGEHSQNFTKMEKGERSPTLDQVYKVCEEFGYSPTWLILNIGQKRLDKTLAVPIEKRVSDLEVQMKQLRRLIQKQNAG